MPKPPLRVLITGAAGQIGYALAPAIASGQMFGDDQPVILQLFDISSAAESLQGLRLELIDGAYPLLTNVVATTNLEEACQGVVVAILLAGVVKRPQMDRREFIAANLPIYSTAAAALQQHAEPDVKVVVVAGPANTNALVLQQCAPRIPSENITALTRLDHNRALAHLAQKLGVSVTEVHNVIIWGTPAASQLPYAHLARVGSQPLAELLPDAQEYLDHEFVSSVQQRGLSIMRLRRLSPALSAARAICDHTRDWLLGTPPATWVSMGVVSTGRYGIQPGLVYSFPVTCHKGQWEVVADLPIDAACWAHMKLVEADLQEEQQMVMQLLRQQQLQQQQIVEQQQQQQIGEQQQQQIGEQQRQQGVVGSSSDVVSGMLGEQQLQGLIGLQLVEEKEQEEQRHVEEAQQQQGYVMEQESMPAVTVLEVPTGRVTEQQQQPVLQEGQQQEGWQAAAEGVGEVGSHVAGVTEETSQADAGSQSEGAGARSTAAEPASSFNGDGEGSSSGKGEAGSSSSRHERV